MTEKERKDSDACANKIKKIYLLDVPYIIVHVLLKVLSKKKYSLNEVIAWARKYILSLFT